MDSEPVRGKGVSVLPVSELSNTLTSVVVLPAVVVLVVGGGPGSAVVTVVSTGLVVVLVAAAVGMDSHSTWRIPLMPRTSSIARA